MTRLHNADLSEGEHHWAEVVSLAGTRPSRASRQRHQATYRRQDTEKQAEARQALSLSKRGVVGTLVAADGSFDPLLKFGAVAWQTTQGQGGDVVVDSVASPFACELHAVYHAVTNVDGPLTLLVDCTELVTALDEVFTTAVLTHPSGHDPHLGPLWQVIGKQAEQRTLRVAWSPGHGGSHPLLAHCDRTARHQLRLARPAIAAAA